MKKNIIIQSIIILTIIIVFSFICFKQYEEIAKQKQKIEKQKHKIEKNYVIRISSELKLMLIQIRHDFLIDAIRKSKENPELLNAIKAGENFRYTTDSNFDFDKKSYSVSFYPPYASCTISFKDFIGYNKAEIISKIKKRYERDLSHYRVSISEEGSKVLTIKLTNNANWSDNLKKILKAKIEK